LKRRQQVENEAIDLALAAMHDPATLEQRITDGEKQVAKIHGELKGLRVLLSAARAVKRGEKRALKRRKPKETMPGPELLLMAGQNTGD